MKLGSLFDGSGGFPLAGAINGIIPAWASEIEPYPIKVTKARFPGMKHLGSVLDVDGGKVEPVDIITFGSPCQDLSVAGKQAGLHKGERSNLFFEAIRIIKEMREATNGKYPRIAVWENVPGAYSSNKGEDFRAVLEAFVRLREQAADVPMPKGNKWATAGCIVGNGYSVAWRTLDAQYNGVPQRRRRIYLIADFGSERAGEILFEQEGLRGHSAESGTEGQGAAGDAEGGVGGGVLFEPMSALEENWTESSVKNALRAGASKSSHAVCFQLCGDRDNPSVSCDTEKAYCLPANPMSDRGQAVCYAVDGSVGRGVWPVISGSLCARADSSPCVDRGQPFIVLWKPIAPQRKYIIRRLSPLECARLQGFPDWWEDGVEGSDSARYKMWGNGIALPNAAYVIGCAKKLIEGKHYGLGHDCLKERI